MEKYKVERLYSYIVTHDTGFAPNPFKGICTLACCKPTIRRSVGNRWNRERDVWIIGLTPRKLRNKVLYIMKVDEVLSFEEYFQAYPDKKPEFDKVGEEKCGDNIYKPIDNSDKYEQLLSYHSPTTKDGCSCINNNQERDLSGKYVLVAKEFVYFGKASVDLSDDLKGIIPTRGHRCDFDIALLVAVEGFINDFSTQVQKGTVVSHPGDWTKEDINSWLQVSLS